jgi:uncharacterized protein (DUF1501 family)
MLDPDISTHDAKALLSFDDRTSAGLNRRRFLQLAAMGAAAGATGGGLSELLGSGLVPGQVHDAWAAGPIGPTDGVVVLVGFDGGNDFLNTTVPYTNGDYYTQRGAKMSIAPGSVLPLNGALGLHPQLGYLKALYDAGQVAVVQGVGYPNPDRSHFSSMANWYYGRTIGNPNPPNGWIGRWLDGKGETGPFAGATVGNRVPLSLIGAVARGTAVPPWGPQWGDGTEPHQRLMYDAVRAFSQPHGRGALQDAVGKGLSGVVEVGQVVGPLFDTALRELDDRLVQRMTVAARLINANLGLRVIDASLDGFDTHSSQVSDNPASPGEHDKLMRSFDLALQAFFRELSPVFRNRVTLMTYSEFGRTLNANDSAGTDHGTASSHFVIGSAVRGGLYGQMPSLANLEYWDAIPFNVDFRSMYTSVIDGWLGGGASTVLGANYENLNLFTRAPGTDPAPPPPVGVVGAGDYFPLTPDRLYDSRNGTGGGAGPLGPGAQVEVAVLGVGGVPASGVTSVAVNVVSVAATEPTTMTVWPSGGVKPNVANVRSLANRAVPNLVIVQVGANGRITIANEKGSTNLVVDVAGYYGPGAGERLAPMTPVRALDTRDGTGGKVGPVGTRSWHDVQVAGANGVPPGVTSVVVNLTAVRPTAKGFATIWPTGIPRPVAASVNFEPNQTVPNLVIAKVGAGGKISVYNENGVTNFVVDVLAYMTPSAPARHVPLTAARVYDAVAGGSAPMGPDSTISLQVLGVGGVPNSGVSAVALNIGAIDATANGFMTAWPTGETMPVAANLNPLANTPVSNLAIVKLGPDGKVNLFNKNGSVKPIIDVVGYYTA